MYTGNILKPEGEVIDEPVYPCVYREHHALNEPRWMVDGLSLCIQGTLSQPFAQACFARFIPVYTENISLQAMPRFPFSVYPCVYREHAPELLEVML